MPATSIQHGLVAFGRALAARARSKRRRSFIGRKPAREKLYNWNSSLPFSPCHNCNIQFHIFVGRRLGSLGKHDIAIFSFYILFWHCDEHQILPLCCLLELLLSTRPVVWMRTIHWLEMKLEKKRRAFLMVANFWRTRNNTRVVTPCTARMARESRIWTSGLRRSSQDVGPKAAHYSSSSFCQFPFASISSRSLEIG